MARTAKLYAWILANPRASISFREFEKVLSAFGMCEPLAATGNMRIPMCPRR